MINLEQTVNEMLKRLRSIPGILDESGRQMLREGGEQIVRVLRLPGRPRRGQKVDWDSDVQQRAYYASGGFGGGIPYTRSGGLEAAWRNEAIAGGYQVSNVGHKAVFMYGTATGVGLGGGKVTSSGQSHIHVGVWPRFRPLVDSVVVKLPARVIQAIKVRIAR